jgi:hypothetical protein
VFTQPSRPPEPTRACRSRRARSRSQTAPVK